MSATKAHRADRYRRNLTRRRRRIHKLLLKRNTPAKIATYRQELIEIEKKLQKSYQQAKDYIEAKAIDSIKTNVKYFYSYAKKFSKVKTKIGPLLNKKEELVNDSKEKAEILSEQFSSVFSKPKSNSDKDDSPEDGAHSILDNILFTEEDMIAAIDELKSTSAAGPDGFPAVLLKLCKESLSGPLTIFWKMCLDEGEIPLSLKQSVITPIHKGGSFSKAVNYRPVALTSHVIKIFEKIVRKTIVDFMNDEDKLNPNQHGFRRGRSCLSQLLDHLDYVLSQLELGRNVDVVYLDFSKAFDKVDFEIVLKKIQNLGIRGKVYNFIKSFITNRKQTVTVDGQKSKPVSVLSGVPQGSVLGPLIFLILIGDIDSEIIDSIVRSFADDTRVSKGITNLNDISKLQEDLFKIYDWAEKSNMEFNGGKFEVMRYGLDEIVKLVTSYVTESGSIITQKSELKDLGVMLSDDCTFDVHITKIVTSAKNLTSWILRTFTTRDATTMLMLWKSLVRPVLEYCSVLWCPIKAGQIQALDALQWSFLRKINGTKDLDYWQCLKKFKLYSLQRRRERYRIIYVWKIIEKLVPNITGTDYAVRTFTSIRHGRKGILPLLRNGISEKVKTLRYATVSMHGVQLFNTMPKSIRELTDITVDKFKRELDEFLGTVPDEPLLHGYTAFRRKESNSLMHMI